MKLRALPIVFLLTIQHNFLFAQASAFGVNLSGLEWGTTQPPTAAEFTYYAGKGLKLIRLPFLWERIQTTLGGSLNSTYLATIDQAVADANAAGVSVILDMHNYCRYPYNGSVINTSGGPTIAQFGSVWRMIAAHYASQSAVYGYDLMNEPNTLGTTTSGGTNYLFPMMQAAIDSVRKADTKKVILVEGNEWSHGNTWSQYNAITGNNLSALVDPNNNLVFEAHQYFDSNGSGTYSSTSFSQNNDATNTTTNTNTGVTLITPFVQWLQANNLKGMVGEYGIPSMASTSDEASWNTLLGNFLAYLQTNCVMGTYWAGGSGWTWNSYPIGIEPYNGTDAPQMATVDQYTTLATSCNPNQPPTVSMTAPKNLSSTCVGTAITLTATATTSTGTISSVVFYDSANVLLSTVTTSPYTFSWTNANVGNHSITAKATNANGTTTSTAITITVNAIPSPPGVTSPVTYCQNATASALTATGTGLTWYPSAAPPSTTTAGTTYHYVSQTVNGCTSTTATIAVVVNASPSSTLAVTGSTVCSNATNATVSIANTQSGVSYQAYKGSTAMGAAKASTSTGGTVSLTIPVNTLSTGLNVISVTSSIGGCANVVITDTAGINVYASPTIPAANATQPTCAAPSGTITFTTQKGVQYSIGSTFQTSPTFSGLAPGGYSLSVRNATDNACVTNSSNQVVINLASLAPTVPTVSNVTQPTCSIPTGTITFNTQSGVQYSIGSTFHTSSTFSGLAPSSYTISVRNILDTTCVTNGSSSVTINAVPTVPSAPTVTSPVTYCQNATASALTAKGTALKWYTQQTGGNPASITPTPSTTSVGTTDYYVSQTANTCESPRTTVAVIIKALPTIAITSPKQDSAITGNPTATVTIDAVASGASKVQFYEGSILLGADSLSPYSYVWSGIATGNYTLTAIATDTNRCTNTSSSVALVVNGTITGLETNSITNGISYYPNPFTEVLTVTLVGQFDYQVYDLSGGKLMGGQGADMMTLAGSSLSTGMYLLKITQDQTTKVFKISKQ